MRTVFADSSYWVALFYSQDELHPIADTISESLETSKTFITTSEMVLIEVLNFFCKFEQNIRQQVATTISGMQNNPTITVIPQTTELFDRALNLYTQCPDKQWSLTDCSSFVLMQDLEIQAALTHDKHFEQAGFQVLMRKVTD
ncbi:type II toxin-antitoxin system VapC family toxin [Leptolyngbya sp. NK1-12]|uniref:Type II toxin-antitoxin system VapC family toxin n=1 Tax=Leptolyngbya sp. NK1-12 TaxID=2547451 RepID=A0AA96WIZ5_9CYAN|nr:type II toxin-antitoxin system VapC family toxin [Leptolyngbya sp. NK1-12]